MHVVDTFCKYHGLGNDFLIFDRRASGDVLSSTVVRKLCDRHRGVGGDGVLTLLAPTRGGLARMLVQNADGSRSDMCGNGLRCVARYLHDVDGQEEAAIEAGRHTYLCRRTGPDRFQVDMGRARLQHEELPDNDGGRVTLKLASHADAPALSGVVIHLGNPHFVTFVDEPPQPLAQSLGPHIERHPAFPHRTNASFVRLQTAGALAIVWERGVGITQACGSGACAVAVAGVVEGFFKLNEPILVELLGGLLSIEVQEGYRVRMEGEAHRVFEGRIPLGGPVGD